MLFHTRRQFVASSIKAAAAVSLLPARAEENVDLAIVHNATPAMLLRKAIELLGGISRFVKPGQSVLLKPNMSWDRFPEQAANTNPELVAEMVRLCRDAGARQIKVLDRTCNHAQRCYARSGIEVQARAAGAQVRHIIDSRFVDTPIPLGCLLHTWPIYKDALQADVIINMPIAKHHSVSGMSLGMKNVMGLLGGDRGQLHTDFDKKIVDLNTVIRPTLTLIDAYRILTRNGPSGGSLDDVELKKTIVAGIDPVATDAYAASFFAREPTKVAYLVQAETRGLGKMSVPDSRRIDFTFPS